MKIVDIEIKSFRNHDSLIYKPESKVNVICGQNGTGKTSIIEAIHYLSFFKSFRDSNDENLLKRGERRFYIKAKIVKNEKENVLEVAFQNKNKYVFLNGKKISKLSEVRGTLNTIIFFPGMASLFLEGPNIRRNVFNSFLFKISDKYSSVTKNYNKLLKERNEALKKDKIDKDYIFILTNQMIEYSFLIMKFRLKFINALNEQLSSMYREISNQSKTIELKYNSVITIDELYKEKLLKLYQYTYPYDLALKNTTKGIHREDISLFINNENIVNMGSQGENRICVIAILLAVSNIQKEYPILLLDDGLSELDEENKTRLLKYIKRCDQVFITNTSRINNENNYEIKE